MKKINLIAALFLLVSAAFILQNCKTKPVPDLCNNGIQDSGELGVDCGGTCPTACPTPIDLCNNGVQDAGELGVDCGGTCPTDCPPPIGLCNNGRLDPGEVQVDCGGTCPTACVIRDPNISQELMITDQAITDSADARSGVFSFGHLMKKMARTESDADVKAFILEFFKTWESNQTVNSFTINARPNIRTQVIDPWKRLDHGGSVVSDAAWNIQLENAPFRLMAITNRVDLHKINADGVTMDRTGEGRFTYCLFDPVSTQPRQFTIIFEYNFPGSTVTDLVNWTKRWHHLGTFPSVTPAYIAELKTITEDFSGRNKMPAAPNGNAIAQVRTNENALNPLWELREFNVDAGSGLLRPVTRKQTPDFSFNSGPKEAQLAAFLNDPLNQAIIDDPAQTLEIPVSLSGGAPFMAGNVPTQGLSFKWEVTGVTANRSHIFSKETCNGCHGVSTDTSPFNPTTNVNNGGLGFTTFTHIKPRFVNERTVLSNFLAGPGLPEDNFENELEKRAKVMKQLMGEIPATSDELDAIIAFIKSRGNRTH